jgi:protein-(glutamine-N5) methyltransferase, release factor-specific
VLPSEAVRRAAAYLERHQVESPLANAELLLANVLAVDRSGLYRRTDGLTTTQAKLFGRALCRRCVGTPLQHITGEQGFRRLTLEVRPGVFVPRPETETVVEVGLAAIRGLDAPNVVDMGTGAGAIALAIADEHAGANVWGVDLSSDAVSLAAANAEHLGLDVVVVHGDLWEAVPSELKRAVDLVITNPPYLEPEALGELPSDVRADPRASLFGGVAIHRRMMTPVADWLRKGGVFVTEIGDAQGREVAALAQAVGLADVAIHQDLTGRDRAVSGRKP